jgi:Mg2+ and Co2+ transporter CorA
VLGKLRKVEDEMSQDADFLLLPQSQSMLQNISAGSTGLMNVNDTILGLYRVIQSLPEEYRKLQQDSLREMETWFRRLGKASSRIQSNMAGMEKN